MSYSLNILASITLLSLPIVSVAETVSLPAYDADITQTSVSGLSSGAFMAAQFQVANSSKIIGAGIIAGGPFYCAGSYSFNTFLENAMNTCMHPLTASVAPQPDVLIKKAQEFASNNEVDALDNLQKEKIYIFSGQADRTVIPLVVDTTYQFYKQLNVPEENIKYVTTVNAGHAIITNNDNDVTCSLTAPPYINDCNFMQSHDILRHIYGNDLNPPAKPYHLSGDFVSFNQFEFIDSNRSSMSQTGFAYIPNSCNTEHCRVHVVFHGCEQGAKKIGNDYYSGTGYNELADTNNIIVLYPQVEPSNIPYNPKGCWDFWGYTSTNAQNPNFYSHTAPQISAVMKMVERLASSRAQH
ncbi:PHB depolymerase family esterase [Beggiatoa leptomitoformis]|uniref:Poly(3-hydroxybutyrate) depolymerase n=1 Tax=Beggiatoa leptomitoformis TaxID=288004 RepID=A0A2N9YJR7_9GAMM|nr:PHB depolymerase family esterase [Beggiatoa leptomitoformis]ALG69466.2 poly(3-hydroxybutyrate) depolymerase [Beggiatoa leptomitoformis]AUI70625.2 poly(3-hydroxybutyrate) depolymerase [Beggiatoa leptomitoformis]